MRWIPVALASVLAMAGCLSNSVGKDGASGLPGPDLDGDGKADPVVYDGSGTVMAGAGTPVGSFTNGAGGVEFSVSQNVTLLYFELSWDSPIIALDLCIHAPSDGTTQGIPICGEVADGGGTGTPTGFVAVTRIAPEAGGGWTASVYPDGPAANLPYQLKVTAFLGETSVPDGYTAIA